MKNLVEWIVEAAHIKLKAKHWTCYCAGCTLNEIKQLSDDEMYEIIKNYDPYFMD